MNAKAIDDIPGKNRKIVGKFYSFPTYYQYIVCLQSSVCSTEHIRVVEICFNLYNPCAVLECALLIRMWNISEKNCCCYWSPALILQTLNNTNNVFLQYYTPSLILHIVYTRCVYFCPFSKSKRKLIKGSSELGEGLKYKNF